MDFGGRKMLDIDIFRELIYNLQAQGFVKIPFNDKSFDKYMRVFNLFIFRNREDFEEEEK